jgi:hypothetical protein
MRNREEVHPTPFKKERRHPQVSSRQDDRDFSRPKKNHTPNDPKCCTKLATHQRATTALQSPSSSHRGPCCEASKTEKKELLRGQQYNSKREGTTSTTVGGSRPDAAAWTTRPILARSGLGQAHKAPPPHCSKQATDTATPAQRTRSSDRQGRRHRA